MASIDLDEAKTAAEVGEWLNRDGDFGKPFSAAQVRAATARAGLELPKFRGASLYSTKDSAFLFDWLLCERDSLCPKCQSIINHTKYNADVPGDAPDAPATPDTATDSAEV